jgi:hypothetical protein
MDLRLPGVVIGFFLLGALTARLQHRFELGTTALELYVVQFASMWISFLIIGSLEVVSQIFVYFFWPIYFLLAFEWLRRRRKGGGGRIGSPTTSSDAVGFPRRDPGRSSPSM